MSDAIPVTSCTCPAHSYDRGNAVHESYCAMRVTGGVTNPPVTGSESLCASHFRKRPIVIEAMLYDGSEASQAAIVTWTQGRAVGWFGGTYPDGDRYYLDIGTLEGRMRADIGDWVIKGVAGEFYPCKPDIFEATYEQVKA